MHQRGFIKVVAAANAPDNDVSESPEAARDWYHSDAYQEAVKLRQAAADCHGAILHGLG